MHRPDIDAIEARASAAQPGPWSAQDRWPILVDANGHAVGDAALAGPGPNSEFIAASRADVPALCSYANDLEAHVGLLWDQLRALHRLAGYPPPPAPVLELYEYCTAKFYEALEQTQGESEG